MLMQVRSGFMAGGRAVAPGPTLVGHTSSGDSDTVSMPGGIASGDFGIFVDQAFAANSSPPPTDTFPSGWTRIGTTLSDTGGTLFNAQRMNVGCKVLDGTETTLTGMSGAFAAAKHVLVFRSGLTWGTPADVEGEVNNNYGSSKVVNVIAGALIVVGYVASNSGNLSMSPSGTTYVQSSSNGSLAIGYRSYGAAASDNTISSGENIFCIGGFYVPLT